MIPTITISLVIQACEDLLMYLGSVRKRPGTPEPSYPTLPRARCNPAWLIAYPTEQAARPVGKEHVRKAFLQRAQHYPRGISLEPGQRHVAIPWLLSLFGERSEGWQAVDVSRIKISGSRRAKAYSQAYPC